MFRLQKSKFHRSFSSVAFLRNAQILSGTKLASKIRQEAGEKIAEIQNKNPQFAPSLTILQVGGRPDSSTYVKMKLKAAESSRIQCNVTKLPEEIDEISLLNEIEKLNADNKVHGILIQLPLPRHLDEATVTNAVVKEKDVDGFSRYNIGELSKRKGKPTFVPCTPAGIIELLKEAKVEVRGKRAVVIGRSDIVGFPVTTLLQKLDATVTMCHSATKNIEEHVKAADIVVAAVGRPNFVKGEWLKPGAVVIDVGINYVPDSSKKSGQRLVGDVDFESAKATCGALTPVPGGVGPMTVAMLVKNVLQSAEHALEQESKGVELLDNKLELKKPVPSDYQISKDQTPIPATRIAQSLGLHKDEFSSYGEYKGKVHAKKVLERLQENSTGDAGDSNDASYVVVTGITPTPLGEGKSTTTIGLVQALGSYLKVPAAANVRQPSMGPTFGVKGGAAGGGYSQVIPMDEFNMHLTGDIHAIGIANNLLAAAIDARIFHEATQPGLKFYSRLTKNGFTPSMLRRLQKLGIDKTDPKELTDEEKLKFAVLDMVPDTVAIKRVVDVNDRVLRQVTVGQAPSEKGLERRTGFDITVASELMAILALSRDLKDMRERIGRIIVAQNSAGEPVTCEDVGCAGAVAALMKDAFDPTLMQTLQGQPVFVHAGPFANISIGASSVVADKLALKLLGPKGIVVTEAGFDFTMGGERFFDIKCRSAGLKPKCVVVVATTRALKSHGGAPAVKPGMSLPKEYVSEHLDYVEKGCANMMKQIQNARSFGVPVVVAVNQFSTDSAAELEIVRQKAIEAGALDAVATNHWEKGGEGAIELAKAVSRAVASEQPSELRFLYDDKVKSVEAKLNAISTKMYGAKRVVLSELAQKQAAYFEEKGLSQLPICIAKTQYSLSHDAKLKGVPSGFDFPIREIKLANGGGYLYALAGEIMTIPGLPTYSGFMNVDLNEDGEIEGLF